MRASAFLIALSILSVAFIPSYAAWPENGVLLSSVAANVVVYGVVGDGADGCIVVWVDDRNGDYDLFAQRLDGNGNPLWGANGVAVCVQPNPQLYAVVVPDDAGGAFVIWQDARTSVSDTDIYAQRIGNNGSMAWQANGRPICVLNSSQTGPVAYSEGSVFVTAWIDNRNLVTSGVDVYAQRVDGNGNALWAVNGSPVCTFVGGQANADIISDGGGGAFVAWEDGRAGTLGVYATHVNFLGSPDWTSGGNAISSDGAPNRSPKLVSDGQGGMIIVWTSELASGRVYAQRYAQNAVAAWGGGTNNTILSAVAPVPGLLHATSDGSGGAIVVWNEFRSPTSDVYAQRITPAGMQMWGASGGPVSTAAENQGEAGVVADGDGGAVILFVDDRQDPGNTQDLLAQHMSASGIPQWAQDGIPIATGPGNINDYDIQGTLSSDGGIMAGWYANSGSNLSVAQRIEPRYGYWGRPEPVILSVADFPGDQGGQVVVNWSASDRDNLSQQEITHYSLWRATETLPGASAGAAPAEGRRANDGDVRRVKLGDVGPDFAGAAVREGTINGVSYLWEFVTTQQAIYSPGYSDLVATRQDETVSQPAPHYFQVVAHTADSQIFFPSAPDSGHSVDNLAPAAPLALTAQRSGGDNVDLDWSPSGMNEADFKEYWIYRGTTSGFPTDPPFFLASTPDTMSTDTNASSGGVWYYKVVAVDIHDNSSDDSNEAFVSPVTGIGDRTPSLTALTVRNHPNPFSGTTEIQIGLPSASVVMVEVYDVAGRRVAQHSLGTLSAGYQSVVFDGRDASGQLLPSGVYFYRVSATSETVTRKIVIRR